MRLALIVFTLESLVLKSLQIDRKILTGQQESDS
jgi:hypothetical protein